MSTAISQKQFYIEGCGHRDPILVLKCEALPTCKANCKASCTVNGTERKLGPANLIAESMC
jgi:hypothetical protein